MPPPPHALPRRELPPYKFCADPEPNPQKNDFLFRNPTDRLVHFLKSIHTPFVLGIVGEWGKGKTFLIRKLISDKAITEKSKIVEFDAWSIPSGVSLFSHLLENLKVEMPLKKDKDWSKAINLAVTICVPLAHSLVPGIGLRTLLTGWLIGLSAMYKEEREKQNKAIKELPSLLSRNINEGLKNNKKERLIIFVDNLDRCLPEVALDFFEKIKHFLRIENCLFIIAYDRSIIQDAIRLKYGKETHISAQNYLEKIVDFEMDVPPSDGVSFIELISERLAEHNNGKMNAAGVKDKIYSLGTISPLFSSKIISNPRKLFRMVKKLFFHSLMHGGREIDKSTGLYILLIGLKEYFPVFFQTMLVKPIVFGDLLYAKKKNKSDLIFNSQKIFAIPSTDPKSVDSYFFDNFGNTDFLKNEDLFLICNALWDQIRENDSVKATYAGSDLQKVIADLTKYVEDFYGK